MRRLNLEATRLSSSSSEAPAIQLRVPSQCLSWQNRSNIASSLRPYREGGLRLEKEKVKGKVIYHNYGYGGGGISIAYGGSLKLIENEFLPEGVSLDEELCVLGSGVVGLTTAYLLVQKGYKVNLYGNLMPFQQEKGEPQLTSTVAAGYWMPLKVANCKNEATDSWKHFIEMLQLQQKTGRNVGVTKMHVYNVTDPKATLYTPIQGIIDPKAIKIDFGDGIKREAVEFDSLMIEPTFYLPYLMEELQRSGKFRLTREVFDTEKIFSKKEKHIFNCCGLASSSLFGDKNKNYGIKGHIIHFDLDKCPQLCEKTVYMIVDGENVIMIFPQPKCRKFVIGGTFQIGKTDPRPEENAAKQLCDKVQKYFEVIEQQMKKRSL